MDLENFKLLLGAIPSTEDARDWTATAAMPEAQIPNTVMVKMPPIVSQGKVGNCVMQSVRTAPNTGVPTVIFMTPVTNVLPNKFGVWSNEGNIYGWHDVVIAGFAPHNIGSATVDMAKVRNSWGDDWGEDGYCWMTWADVFRGGEVWAIYPPNKGTGKFGVDMGYGRWREHDTPGLHTRIALEGYSKEGIAPLTDDPNNTEVTEVITYAKQTNAARLLKAAAPYKGATYFRLTSVDAVKAVLYEAYLGQNNKVTPTPIVTKHTTLRYKSPYMRDKDTVTGNDVSLCQELLRKNNCAVVMDGVFGRKTEAGVKAFQKGHKLVADGIVGIKTWAALLP